MVFDPTFGEIDREAQDLPDLEGAAPDADRDEVDGGLGASPEDQDAAVEGEAIDEITEGDLPASELPPLGA